MARTFNLLDGSYKPLAGADDPEAEGVNEDDTESDWGVVESLGIDGIELRKAKNDQHEGDPERGDDRGWVRELAKVEGTSHKSVRVDDAQGDGHS